MSKQKYNTNELMKAIRKKYPSIKEFARVISKKTGIKEVTVDSHLRGYYSPKGTEELKIIAKDLGFDEDKLITIFFGKQATSNSKPKVEKKKSVAKKFSKSSSSQHSFDPEIYSIRPMVNCDKIDEFLEKRGMSKNKAYEALSFSKNTFWGWKKYKSRPNYSTLKKVAALLCVKVEDIVYTKEEEDKILGVTSKPKPETMTENKSENVVSKTEGGVEKGEEKPNFKRLPDTQNVMNIFSVINDNILLLGDMTSKTVDKAETSEPFDIKGSLEEIITNQKKMFSVLAALGQIGNKIEDDIQAMIDIIAELEKDVNKSVIAKESIAQIQKDVAKETDKKATATKPAAKSVAKPSAASITKAVQAPGEKPATNLLKECMRYRDGYNADDSFRVYQSKIYGMVGLISQVTGDTHKQILHKKYESMTTIYGVVYDQLKKEYRNKYQKKAAGSLELIYESPLYRQIFYNIILDKLEEVAKN